MRQLEATVAADQANIDAAQVQLDYTTIKAPLSGRTGIRLLDQGNIVHATDTTGLVVITQLQPISVVFTLPQDQLQEVIREMPSTRTPLKVFAPGRDGQQHLAKGQLALVDNVIDQTTGSVRLKATFPNQDYALWPGQYVNIRLLLQDPAAGRDGSVHRRPARAGRHVCLCRQAGLNRCHRAGQRRPDDRRHVGDRKGPRCRHPDRDGRTVPAAAGQPYPEHGGRC